jgi:hypothetical protein
MMCLRCRTKNQQTQRKNEPDKLSPYCYTRGWRQSTINRQQRQHPISGATSSRVESGEASWQLADGVRPQPTNSHRRTQRLLLPPKMLPNIDIPFACYVVLLWSVSYRRYSSIGFLIWRGRGARRLDGDARWNPVLPR